MRPTFALKSLGENGAKIVVRPRLRFSPHLLHQLQEVGKVDAVPANPSAAAAGDPEFPEKLGTRVLLEESVRSPISRMSSIKLVE
mmetsp:Transcript_3491/g.5658  ORF Transcript_3491/g.5658 Transcript_3491/m.5658 type:complete len:85 (+) Transcript_3491:813-1067(+)